MELGLPPVLCVACKGAVNTPDGQALQPEIDIWQICHWGWCPLPHKVVSAAAQLWVLPRRQVHYRPTLWKSSERQGPSTL